MSEEEIRSLMIQVILAYPRPRATNLEKLGGQIKLLLKFCLAYGIIEAKNKNSSDQETAAHWAYFLSGLHLLPEDPTRPQPTTTVESALEYQAAILSQFTEMQDHEALFQGLPRFEHRSLAVLIMALCVNQVIQEDLPFNLLTFKRLYCYSSGIPEVSGPTRSDFTELQLRVLKLLKLVGNDGTPSLRKPLAAFSKIKDYPLWTPLHFVAMEGNMDHLQILLQGNGVENLRKKNEEGLIPLDLAAKNGWVRIIETLAPRQTQEELKAALVYAKRHEHSDAITLLNRLTGPTPLLTTLWNMVTGGAEPSSSSAAKNTNTTLSL